LIAHMMGSKGIKILSSPVHTVVYKQLYYYY